jgi:AraC-like DNA-binding protein
MYPMDVLAIPARDERVSMWVVTPPRRRPAETVLWNMHQAYEIEVVLRGRQERSSDGLAWELGPGDMTLTPGWEPHGYRPLTADAEVLVIFFIPSFLGDETLGDVPWFAPFAVASGDRPQVTTPEMRERALAIATELAREPGGGNERGPVWRTAVRLGVLRLLLILLRTWSPPATDGRRRTQASDLARVAPALGLASTRPGQRVEVAEAASACSLSVSRFGAIFHRSMGMSFARFELRARLTGAAQLILATDDPMHLIAAQTGFSDASHLYRAFAKCYGCTPVTYRRRAGAPPREQG